MNFESKKGNRGALFQCAFYLFGHFFSFTFRVFFAGPEFEGVFAVARHYVDVGVKYQLSRGGTVVHPYIYAGYSKFILNNRGDFFGGDNQFSHNFIRSVVDIFKVFFWNYQNMSWVYRFYIKKSKQVLILIHF